jgi:hypothetical protein
LRLPRLRFTVRRLMLAVGLAGLAMGGAVWGYRMWRLSAEYERRANAARSHAGYYRPKEARYRGFSEEAAKYKAITGYYAARARKYQRASRYPWVPIEPDQPDP